MRKEIILVLLLAATNIYSQFEVSLKNGISITQFHKEGSENPVVKNKTFYYPEVDFTYYYKQIGINLGLSYKTLGVGSDFSKSSDPSTDGLELSTRYSYISIPLYLSYKKNINNFYIIPQAGISLNILNKAKDIAYQDGSKIAEEEVTYGKDLTKDILLGIGVGYKFTEHLSADIHYRYNIALDEFVDYDDVSIQPEPDKISFNSMNILLGVNYTF